MYRTISSSLRKLNQWLIKWLDVIQSHVKVTSIVPKRRLQKCAHGTRESFCFLALAILKINKKKAKKREKSEKHFQRMWMSWGFSGSIYVFLIGRSRQMLTQRQYNPYVYRIKENRKESALAKFHAFICNRFWDTGSQVSTWFRRFTHIVRNAVFACL